MMEGAAWARDGEATSKRGVKRQLDESNDDDLRFTKRFNLLSIDAAPNGAANSNSNYYIPVSAAAQSTQTNPSGPVIISNTTEDGMLVDDTRDRVYIHNLDAEVAEIEASEPTERLIFLPDIEKHFSKIPEQVLMNRRASLDSNHEGQELVLYSVPKSLTLNEEQDSVRKAIVEARGRAREKAAEQARQEEMERKYGHSGDQEVVETAHGYSGGYTDAVEDDPDAMDIE